jgi:cytochrome c-type biogenesis protein CcmH/NrfG
MPATAGIVENGVMGELASVPVLCSALLWSTAATGQGADRHGVLDSFEPDPRTGGVRPVTRASLRAVPVWDILAHEGLCCQTVGWPATHPAGPPAISVSDGFAHGVPHSIYPETLESTLGPLRFRPQEWTGDDLRLFVPGFERIDQDNDTRLARLAGILAEAAGIHAAATTLLERGDWDFTAVRFPTLAQAREIFPAGTDEVYRDVVSGIHRYLDLFLARLRHLAGPDAMVILVSECSPRARGILCAAGKGIAADELTFGASLTDLAPTILGLFDFAPAPGMAGTAIRDICPGVPARRVNAANCVPPPAPVTPPEIERDLRELAELGYRDRIAADLLAEAEQGRKRREFNLARVLLAQARAAEAVTPLEKLAAEEPGNCELRLYLGHAYFQSGRVAECRRLCEALLADWPDSPLGPLARAHLAMAEGKYREARAHLEEGREAYGVMAALDAAIGEVYLHIGNWRDAAEAFRSAIAGDSTIPAAHQGLAQALFEQQLYQESAEAALDAIGLRYDAPAPHRILGRSLRALGREEAAEAAFATAQRVSGPRAV